MIARTHKLLKFFSSVKNCKATFCASNQVKWTQNLEIIHPNSQDLRPMYRVLDKSGKIIKKEEEPQLGDDILRQIYRKMVQVNVFDKILYESQRQGRISFYLTSFGEEAVVGSAVPLSREDIVYLQYRESVIFLWRGYTVTEMINQCFGNANDGGRGKQMPLAYGSHNLNLVTVSPPIASMMPQAVGAAYAVKGQNKVVICYFGEGASSEGDAHAAFNFAATLDCPVIFFCRNNGYAISTPASEQFRGDGVVAHGPGYGMSSIRIDGNDVFAVYNATKKAREYCLSENKPVLIEAMTYRISHHSTSDDSLAYRTKEELKEWASYNNPIHRYRKYLEDQRLWNDDMENEWSEQVKSEILAALDSGEKCAKPNWTVMFDDIYKEMPQHIRKQVDLMKRHMEKYGDKYPLQKFSG